MNTTQNSRIAGTQSKNMFAKLNPETTKGARYNAINMGWEGNPNPQLVKQTPANAGHYLLLAGVVVAVLLLADYKMPI